MTDPDPSNVTLLHPPKPAPPKLLPCPFCGEDQAEIEIEEDFQDYVYVVCPDCFAQGPRAFVGCRDPDEDEIDLEAEAIHDWNTRANPLSLRMFTNGSMFVVAYSFDDAKIVYTEHIGHTMSHDCPEWMHVSGNTRIRIRTWQSGPYAGQIAPIDEVNTLIATTDATADEWIARTGRGFLCTSDA